MTTPARPLAPLITLTEEPQFSSMMTITERGLRYTDLRQELNAQRIARAEDEQEIADLRARLAAVEQEQQQTRQVLDPLFAVRPDVSNADLARNLWELTENSHERASIAERNLAEARDRLARLEEILKKPLLTADQIIEMYVSHGLDKDIATAVAAASTGFLEAYREALMAAWHPSAAKESS